MIAVASRTGARLFYFESVRPHVRLDGAETMLAVWRGHCRQCGAAFHITSPMPREDGHIVSKAFGSCRCDKCKSVKKKKNGAPDDSKVLVGNTPEG